MLTHRDLTFAKCRMIIFLPLEDCVLDVTIGSSRTRPQDAQTWGRLLFTLTCHPSNMACSCYGVIEEQKKKWQSEVLLN